MTSYGPFHTEREAAALPEVRAIYDAMHAAGLIGPAHREAIRQACSGLITAACERAGVELGAHDHVIVAWLGGFEPQTCAVIAALVSRAYAAGQSSAEGASR
jgi:hypothetical protein